MKAEGFDEREHTGAFEIDFPSYVVYFFRGTSLDSIRLTEVHNVHQALAWADANAQGRRFVLFAEVARPWAKDEPLGLVQLCGDDAFRPDDPHRVPPPDLAPAPD
jgi:hypothetical protein